MQKYIGMIKKYLYFDKTSWIVLIVSVVVNLILWYIWVYQINFSKTVILFSSAVLIVNIVLAFFVSRKDTVMPYFFLGTAFLVQIFTLILLKYTSFIT